MDILKELAKNKTLLVVIPGNKYRESIAKITKLLSKKKVCYITLNTTCDAMKQFLGRKKINLKNMIWIDAISKTLRSVPSKTEDCLNISSPGALTELSLTITKTIKGFDYLVMDAINNLLVYRNKATVARFLVDLVSKIEGSNTKMILYALHSKEQEALINEASTFVDKVIEIK